MARKIIIAGNWKMNNTVSASLDLVKQIRKKTSNIHRVEIVVAPPFTAINPIYELLSGSQIQVAGQNVFWEEEGAYTGEVSPIMLKEAGCKYVIIGHSERRQYFGETDETVNRKIKISLKFGLKIIVCVGESLDERETGKTLEILASQVVWALKGLEKEDLDHVVIAYEPIWAIGTGKTATPAQADEAHAHIRKEIKELYGDNVANDTRILYGGSMKPGNAAELLNLENIDGGLIGGASLKAGDFVAIIDAGVKASE